MGRPAGLSLSRGNVAKVHTGGMLADGADAVVMVENTQPVDDTTIEVVRPVAPGERAAGRRRREDGQLLLSSGHLLRPQDIGRADGPGYQPHHRIAAAPVSFLSTGDELVPRSRR